MTTFFDRSEPELPGLNDSYWTGRFKDAERSLDEGVLAINTLSESDRQLVVGTLANRLDTCWELGRHAGIPLPTEVMTAAQSAIDTTTID